MFLKQGRNIFLQGFYSNERPVATVFLLNYCRMFKMVLELGGALDSRIANLTHFVRVEFLPFSQVKVFIEISDEFDVDKVDESITNVTTILNKIKSTL